MFVSFISLTYCAMEDILVTKHSLMLRPNTEVIISCTFPSLTYRIIGPYKDVFRSLKMTSLRCL